MKTFTCHLGLLILLLFSGCTPPTPATTNQTTAIPKVMFQGNAEKEIIQTLTINNCDGMSDVSRIEERSQSIEVTISTELAAQIGASAEIISGEVEAAVAAATSQGGSRAMSIQLTAPPQTHMQFQLIWTGDEQVGVVQNFQGTNVPIAFNGFIPTDVRIKSQNDIGCPGSSEYQAAIENQPTEETPTSSSPNSNTEEISSTGNCVNPEALSHRDPIVGEPWILPNGGWIIVNFWSNEPGNDQVEHKLLLTPNDSRSLLGGGSAWYWQDECESEARRDYTGNPLPQITLDELNSQGLVYSYSNTENNSSTANCLNPEALSHRAPIVGEPWILPNGGWIIVNFWSNEPGNNQAEHKLLLAPNDSRSLLGGGSAWYWQDECESEARKDYNNNPLPKITLDELESQGLVN